MNKEITMYELLGLLKNNNAPRKIKFDDTEYIYILSDNKYYYRLEYNIPKILTDDYNIFLCLNDKVEIIEEDKDIEEINFVDNFTDSYYDTCLIKIQDKTNELVREVNKLRKEIK